MLRTVTMFIAGTQWYRKGPQPPGAGSPERYRILKFVVVSPELYIVFLTDSSIEHPCYKIRK
jgi:hypothetical protein